MFPYILATIFVLILLGPDLVHLISWISYEWNKRYEK